MARCADCHWLVNAPPSGRTPKACVDLGELPQNRSCDRFTLLQIDKDPVPFEPEPMEPKEVESAIGALLNQNYRHIFGEVLSESFLLEQDGELALKNIQHQLQAQGATITVEAHEYKRTLNRLIDLYVTYRLALATGLGPYVDEIMTKEIDRRFRFIPDTPKRKT